MSWKDAPTHTITGMMELYEQLTPAKLYTALKTRTARGDDATCRMCGKAPESLAHALSCCSALAQNRYLLRTNGAFQVLFCGMLRDLGLADSIPLWYSRVDPKPLYESPEAKAYWDVPVFAEHEHLPQNRVDAIFINHKEKKVIAVEMSCPWVENRA